MRIISDFHDYYDCIQSVGQDQNLVYFRNKRIIKHGRQWPFPSISTHRFWDRECNLDITQYVVGFCDKIYPMLSVRQVPPNKSTLCYSIRDIDKFVYTKFRKKYYNAYLATERRNKSAHKLWNYQQGRRALLSFFSKCEDVADTFGHMFTVDPVDQHGNVEPPPHTYPLFVARTRNRHEIELTYNQCLKDYEFYRVLDPPTAFQELQMYLGGLAAPQEIIPPISDKDMIGAKGFNEWSFRKMPKDK